MQKVLKKQAHLNVEKRSQTLLDHSPLCHKIVGLDFNLQYMSANGFKLLKLEPNANVYGKPYPFDFFSEPNMPHMTGLQMAKEIKLIRNDIPIIISTGFSDRLEDQNIGGLGINAVLMKPVIKSEMAETIRKVLDDVIG